MSVYKEQIEDMVYETEKIIEAYTAEYNSCVSGHLLCCKNHGKATFYRAERIDKNARAKRIAIGRDTNAIKELARKEYLYQLIQTLEHNLKILSKTNEAIQSTDLDHLRKKMGTAYRSLPNEYFYGSRGTGRAVNLNDNYLEGIKRHDAWAREPYEKSDYMPDNKKFMTSSGFTVRSKSELVIAEQLIDYGVPFRYEAVIQIGNKTFSPDFTFRDGVYEYFYWEHAGMMDIPGYASHHNWKMKMYEHAGIVPWRNMIITYDKDGIISVPFIKSIIENEVLPRL